MPPPLNEQREIEDDRGKTLVLGAAIAVIVINTLAAFSALCDGSGVAFSLLHALRLAWVFVVAYCAVALFKRVARPA